MESWEKKAPVNRKPYIKKTQKDSKIRYFENKDFSKKKKRSIPQNNSQNLKKKSSKMEDGSKFKERKEVFE